MINDLTTSDLQTNSPGTDVSASGAWSENFLKRPEMPRAMIRLAPVAGLLIAAAVSPATAFTDNWFFERRRRCGSAVTWILEDVIGRSISRVEALRIATQILEDAERERSEVAAWEAKRGILWEAGE